MNAAINGRTEIGNAAIAITMVDVVVFLPVAFLPGIVGAYLKEFGAVIVIATLFSLLVSFTLTPLLAAKWSVKQRSEAAPKWLLVLDNLFVNLAFVVTAASSFALGIIFQIILLKVIGILIVAVLILNLFVHRYDRISKPIAPNGCRLRSNTGHSSPLSARSCWSTHSRSSAAA